MRMSGGRRRWEGREATWPGSGGEARLEREAVLNDGNPECWNDEDELERSTEWVSYYLPGLPA